MNILNLEMSRFFSHVIAKAAGEAGFQYRNERSIEAGLTALKEWDFDLLITANILSDGGAQEFLSLISETGFRDIPVIVVTADDSPENRERFFSLGVMDFLHKSDLVPQKLKLYFDMISRGGEILDELKGFKVAVLDDCNVSLHVIRGIFKYFGVNHVEYFDSPEDMLSAGNFDLYIIDLVISDMTGDEVLLTIKKREHYGGVLFVTGVSNQLSMAQVLSSGADDYISKPFDARDFIIRVKSVVRHLILLKELEERSRQLEDLNKRDSHTGLWNHRAIHEVLEHHIKSEENRTVSILLFDLDNFRSVNDRFGHQAGDDILLASSDMLTRELGEDAEVGRYGGEEFLVILPSKKSEEALKIAEHLLIHFREMDMGLRDLTVTSSCGLADSLEVEDAMKLVEIAERRLRMAKDSGKDRVVG